MKTASVREVQHGLAKVLLWIEAGEKVTITKRNKPIAELHPLETKPSKIKCPDFKKRLRETFAHPIQGISNAELVSEMRGDR